MKKGSTLFLKAVIIGMGLVALAICVFFLPQMAQGISADFPPIASLSYPIMIGLYLAAIPFYIGLYQAFKLLIYIDRNNAFSESSVKALKHIKQCGIAMSALFAFTVMPLFYAVAESDDAPGVIVVGMIITCAPLVVSVFAAVLQRLLRNAIDIKSENDLVV